MKATFAALLLVSLFAVPAGIQGTRSALAAHQPVALSVTAHHAVLAAPSAAPNAAIAGLIPVPVSLSVVGKDKCKKNDPPCCKKNPNDPNCCPVKTKSNSKDKNGCCAYNSDECGSVPPRGQFAFAVHGTAIRLTSTGTPSTAGTLIAVARVAPPTFKQHLQAFKLLANGPIPPLKLAVARPMYLFHPSTSQWTRVGSVTTSGIYAVDFS